MIICNYINIVYLHESFQPLRVFVCVFVFSWHHHEALSPYTSKDTPSEVRPWESWTSNETSKARGICTGNSWSIQLSCKFPKKKLEGVELEGGNYDCGPPPQNLKWKATICQLSGVELDQITFLPGIGERNNMEQLYMTRYLYGKQRTCQLNIFCFQLSMSLRWTDLMARMCRWWMTFEMRF